MTNFDWDTVYVFKYTATAEEIHKVIGVDLPIRDEFTRKLVFVDHGKVVYSEENPTEVEHPINDEVLFDIPDDTAYQAYDRDTVFRVIKKSFAKGVYYELKLVN